MRQRTEARPVANFLDDLVQSRPKAPKNLKHYLVLDGETKRVEISVPEKEHPDFIELLMLTDLQYGHEGFQENRLIEYRDWVLSRPHCFVAFGGDLIDAATPISVASPFDNEMRPSEQIEGLVDILMPLRGRALGYVAGNHERRTEKTYGNAGRLIASLLGIPYSRGVQMIDIYYGKHQPFKVSLWHGTGSARTKGAKAQMVHRFMSQADSDLYFCGHLHDVVLLFDWRQRREGRDQVVLDKVAGVMSSSFQAYWNSYAEEKGLYPSDTMMARAQIEVDGRWAVELR